jgi:acyl-CoA thioesterase-2
MGDPATSVASNASDGIAGQAAVDALVALMDLERVEYDIFRGQSIRTRWQRVFGGQVAGQALVAAGRTVDPERRVHSLHSYFIRPGDPTLPIVYEVDRVRDGRSFSVRRVIAVQNGAAIFSLSASFQLDQDGIDHQSDMPDVPAPETLPPEVNRFGDTPEAIEHHRLSPKPIDLRWVDDPTWLQQAHGPRTGPTRVWLRADGVLPDDPLLHVCLLTYASDMTLLDAVLARHGVAVSTHDIAMASLDHAMWFERPFRADEWLLYVTDSPSASGGRGLASGRFYTESGVQVASVVQEGMIRVR